MKKKILIIIGLILFVIIAIIGIYIIVVGPKSPNAVFNGFGNEGDPTFEETDGLHHSASTTSVRLRQISLRSVAGARIVDERVRFVEAGTGHIYEVSATGGTETLISGTTIPRAIEAVFNDTGESVAVISESGSDTELPTIVVGTIPRTEGENFTGHSLPYGSTDPQFETQSTSSLRFLLPDSHGSRGIAYNVDTKKTTTLFTLPLRDITALWGSPIYVYTKPSVVSKGSLYRVDGNSLNYVTQGGKGLIADRFPGGIFVTRNNGGIMESYIYTKEASTRSSLSLFPEKCASNGTSSTTIYCAGMIPAVSGDLPDSWYKGVRSFSDTLFILSTEKDTAQYLADLLTESGREIDVTGLSTNNDGTVLTFINKNDDTLWTFDLKGIDISL